MTANQHTERKPPHATGAVWRAARRAAAGLRNVHDEQVRMWELWFQANRATVPRSGPLTWVLTLDGYQLAGSHLPASSDTTARGTP